MTLKVPNSKIFPLGAGEQEYKFCKRWAINPDWITELKKLNPGIAVTFDVNVRQVILTALTQACLEHLGVHANKENMTVLIDWDAHELDSMRQVNSEEPKPLIYFICTNPNFVLEEWKMEPVLVDPEFQEGVIGMESISPVWVKWACDHSGFTQEGLITISDGTFNTVNNRLVILDLLKIRLARVTGTSPAAIVALIDWEDYTVQQVRFAPKPIPLQFMSNVNFAGGGEVVLSRTPGPHYSGTSLLDGLGTPALPSNLATTFSKTVDALTPLVGGQRDSVTAGLLGDVSHLVDEPQEANKNTSELNKFPENRGTMN